MTKGVGGSTTQIELSQISPPAQRVRRIGADDHQQRLDKARRLMTDHGVDAMIVNAGHSLRYFTGLAWGATERLVAMVLPRKGEPLMICPAFEIGSLEAGMKISSTVRSWEEDENPYALTAAVLREMSVDTVALDPLASFLTANELRKQAGSMSLVDASPVINGCRMYKSAAELDLMREAKAITLEVHRRTARILAPGISASEVRHFIDSAHRAMGADGGSSFCAVQFGEATSYPHGVPGDQQLAEGEIVLIDTGCLVDGYNADITRTYVFGEPTEHHARMWELEHRAQKAAFDAVRPGVPCEEIDAVARRVLESAGLGPDYRLPGLPHRTGHGIGLSIHEPAYLVRGDKTPLAPGMCFSNEPMIVIPGAFGIRLEDHFYVTEEGAAWFTEPSPSLEAPFG